MSKVFLELLFRKGAVTFMSRLRLDGFEQELLMLMLFFVGIAFANIITRAKLGKLCRRVQKMAKWSKKRKPLYLGDYRESVGV